MSQSKAPIAVIGAGAWGTALAQMAASDGRDVLIWAREDEVVEAVNTDHRNPQFLPSAKLAPTIRATTDLAELTGHDIVLLVTPAQHLGATLQGLSHTPSDLILCSKGIEASTGRLMNDVAQEAAPGSQIAVLAGPTFAYEVADGLPSAVTLACGGGEEQWQRISPALARPSFRPYYSDDLAGAEIGGSVKNVLAIASGVVDGLQLGQNARSALIARGYAEMLRFGEALGARRDTLSGLCGLGDLVLTCSSESSRNFSLGKALGEGQNVDDLMANRSTVAEGAHTAPILAKLADQHDVSMPICDAVSQLLAGAPAKDIVVQLLSRPLRAEGANG